MKVPMLFRFSLYGFLKNQQYYDPFILLFLWQEKGLSFFLIGLLIGFRELMVNLMEVPTGVIADLCGRRRSMVLSLSSYIVSFLIFGLAPGLWPLFAAMVFFAIGEAFRTGTHKAMILDWLRLEGRQSEKTKTYGYTRSWSKIGSAVAVIIAAAIVVTTGSYYTTFLCATIPYVLGIINFLGYPPELEGRPRAAATLGNIFRHLWQAFRQAFFDRRLRRILLESMGYEGTFKVTRDYLQAVVRQLVLLVPALPLLASLHEKGQIAILAGLFYFPLYLVSGMASRKSVDFAHRFGGESRAAKAIWVVTLAVFATTTIALAAGSFWVAAIGFVAAALVQNLWRPITITRVDNEADASMGATMLSIESQAKALGTMALAPLLGLAVDTLGSPGRPALWAVGALGALIALAGSLLPAMRPAEAERLHWAGEA